LNPLDSLENAIPMRSMIQLFLNRGWI